MRHFFTPNKTGRKDSDQYGQTIFRLAGRRFFVKNHLWGRIKLVLVCLCCLCFAAGCIPQKHSSVQHQLISLKAEDLQAYGLAFITPSTVTGQEEEMQAVAFTFAEVLKKKRLDVPCVTLPETLSAINQAGLTEDYKRMFEDYRNTGIFRRDTLQRIGEVTGARYLAQVKLSGFAQGSDGRLSVFGFRLVRTKNARIRLFLQIWNSADGTIVWEGVEELNYAADTITEDPITLREILEVAAEDLISRLPQTGQASPSLQREPIPSG